MKNRLNRELFRRILEGLGFILSIAAGCVAIVISIAGVIVVIYVVYNLIDIIVITLFSTSYPAINIGGIVVLLILAIEIGGGISGSGHMMDRDIN